jgi:HAD superfamily hydrolase (TIGR01509 family)
VASDTTPREELAAPVIDDLRDLIANARCVLFDFDGPVCRLFAGHRAHDVAESLIDWLEERGQHVLLTDEERESGDPHAVLRAVGRIHPGSDLVDELEEILTREELHATATAWPTPYVDPLIHTWRAVGVRLAIATNNSPRVVERYLSTRRLTDAFGPHVHGRTTELHLLKPDPDCLQRALKSTGARPAEALMIGDTPTDLEAAGSAGVPFLGYGRDEMRIERLHRAGAKTVVDSLDLVLGLVRELGQGNGRA